MKEREKDRDRCCRRGEQEGGGGDFSSSRTEKRDAAHSYEEEFLNSCPADLLPVRNRHPGLRDEKTGRKRKPLKTTLHRSNLGEEKTIRYF